MRLTTVPRAAGCRSLLPLSVMLSILVGGCVGGGEAPELLPIQATTVAVNETLHLTLTVRNPSGLAITYTFTGPDLPGLSQVTDITGTPSGGEFIWTPLASHVGSHELQFKIESTHGSDSESALINVVPAPSAAPIFLRPGAGGTYDLAREPTARFDVEVRDDDSSEVEIRLTGTPPDGATLVELGPKQARFEWRPSPEQIDKAERWTIQLEADDGEHAPTRHDYLMVLRSPTTDECPGTAPTLTVQSPEENARVVSDGGFPVVVTVTDDVGVRDAPILYYSTTRPADEVHPDVTAFEQVSTSLSGNQYVARITSIQLGDGEERTVYYLVTVTDNDDPNGATCDHRTDTPLRRFVAVGSSTQQLALRCESCQSSSGCESGVCANASSGSRCLDPCAGGSTCAVGSCLPTLTAEGATVNACGSVDVVCGGGPATCDDDSWEPNDTFFEAADLTSSTIDVQMCPWDDDYFGFEVTANTDADVTVTVSNYDWETIDLDLELLDANQQLLASSAGIEETESVHVCLEPGVEVVALIYGYTLYDWGAYTLTVNQIGGVCCVNDDQEPNDTLETARAVDGDGFFDGRICPGDADYFKFVTTAPGTAEVTLVFEAVDEGSADLDMRLYKSDGTYLTGAFSWTEGEEFLEARLAEAGTYVLRIYSVFTDEAADYLGQVVVTP